MIASLAPSRLKSTLGLTHNVSQYRGGIARLLLRVLLTRRATKGRLSSERDDLKDPIVICLNSRRFNGAADSLFVFSFNDLLNFRESDNW